MPVRKISPSSRGGSRFDGAEVDLRRFERRPGELLLARDLMARHLINLVGAASSGPTRSSWPTSTTAGRSSASTRPTRGLLRRLLPGRLGQRSAAGAIVDWGSIEPFVVPRADRPAAHPLPQARPAAPGPDRRPRRGASHEEGEEIIEAVGQDRELEADVFEELDPEHQVEFLQPAPTPRPPAARIDGARRRRRPHLRARPGASAPDPRAAPRAPAAQDPVAAQLQPRDRRRADEPRLPVLPATTTVGRRARGDPLEHGAPRGTERRLRRGRRRARRSARSRPSS